MRRHLLATTSMVNPIPLTARLMGAMWPPMTTDPEQWAQDVVTFGTAVLVRQRSILEAEALATLREALTVMIGPLKTGLLLPTEALPIAGPVYGRGELMPHPLLQPAVPNPKLVTELLRR